MKSASMYLDSYEIIHVDVPLKREFRIALGTSTKHESVILKLRSEGFVGYGEGAPSTRIMGESLECTKEGIKLIMNEIIGREICIEDLNEIYKKIKGFYSSKAAIDIALHDLFAKKLGIKVRDIYGGSRNSIETSITIGISSIEETLNVAREYVERLGGRILKIKIGENLKKDIERIYAVRKLYPDVRIRVDANQGYNFHEALELFKKIKDLDIEFVEQPLPYWQLDKIAELRKRVDIPIMLDESVKTPHDLLNAIKMNALDMLNIKLMKCGGIRSAWTMIEISRAYDIPVMIGCMGETKVGISAGTHLACSSNVVKYADLDSHLNIAEEIVDGGIETINGVNFLGEGEGEGLGILGIKYKYH